MAGFLQDNQKLNIKNIIDEIHLTFAREITVFKAGQKLSMGTTPGFNSLYKKNATAGGQPLEEVSKVILARIKYKTADQVNFRQSGNEELILIPEGAVFIKVNYEDYLYIKDAKTVEVDGGNYEIKSPALAQGMFGPQYYKFMLIPLQR